ncbi:hypothetical protein N9Y26_00310 [bacterium]|nr:hypothetical protein [bacterium]
MIFMIKRAFMWKLQGKRNIDIATKLQRAEQTNGMKLHLIIAMMALVLLAQAQDHPFYSVKDP